MARLKAAVLREYEDSEDMNVEIYMPRNTQAVDLYFRGEKMAKVMGSLATKEPMEDLRVSGVLVKRGFNYHLVHPLDLSSMQAKPKQLQYYHEALCFLQTIQSCPLLHSVRYTEHQLAISSHLMVCLLYSDKLYSVQLHFLSCCII